MKYIIVTKEEFDTLAKDVQAHIEKMGEETELNSMQNDIDYVKKIVATAQTISEAKRENVALISIDETGGLAFAAASKVKGMISSQISDEHSSHMTREHNGSVGLNLGAEISAPKLIQEIVELFVKERFAAGRHMVRTDMLDDMA